MFIHYVASIKSIFNSSDCARELRTSVRQLLTLFFRILEDAVFVMPVAFLEFFRYL